MYIQNLAVFAVVAILTGCVAQPASLYNWGSYQQQLYTMYSKPEKADPQRQIAVLEKDIQKAKASNRAIPPGLYAHLGYQYSLIGNNQKAREYLDLEKQVYPESSTFVDRILQRLG